MAVSWAQVCAGQPRITSLPPTPPITPQDSFSSDTSGSSSPESTTVRSLAEGEVINAPLEVNVLAEVNAPLEIIVPLDINAQLDIKVPSPVVTRAVTKSEAIAPLDLQAPAPAPAPGSPARPTVLSVKCASKFNALAEPFQMPAVTAQVTALTTPCEDLSASFFRYDPISNKGECLKWNASQPRFLTPNVVGNDFNPHGGPATGDVVLARSRKLRELNADQFRHPTIKERRKEAETVWAWAQQNKEDNGEHFTHDEELDIANQLAAIFGVREVMLAEEMSETGSESAEVEVEGKGKGKEIARDHSVLGARLG